MKLITTSFVFCIMIFANNLFAEVNLEFYQGLSQNMKKNITKQYITGVGKGILWASIYSEMNKNPIFCQPKNLVLDGDNYISILDQEIKSKYYAPNSSIEMILLFGLIHTFPCQNEK